MQEDFFIYYSYPYKGFFEEKAEKFFEFDEQGLARGISNFLKFYEASFIFSGIDYKGVREYIKSLSPLGFEEALKKLSLKKLKEFSVKETLSPIAENYGLVFLLRSFGIEAFPPPSLINGNFGVESFEKKIGIGVMLKYKSWVVIKKLSYEEVEDYFVAGAVSSILDSLALKFYELLDFEKPKKKRKSLSNFRSSLSTLNLKNMKLNDYFELFKSFIENGFSPYATLEMLSKEYKNLKPKRR